MGASQSDHQMILRIDFLGLSSSRNSLPCCLQANASEISGLKHSLPAYSCHQATYSALRKPSHIHRLRHVLSMITDDSFARKPWSLPFLIWLTWPPWSGTTAMEWRYSQQSTLMNGRTDANWEGRRPRATTSRLLPWPSLFKTWDWRRIVIALLLPSQKLRIRFDYFLVFRIVSSS